MTVLTLFDSDRARGAVLSDAAQWVCCACAVLHARRCLRGAERPWGGEKALDGGHGSRCEEAQFVEDERARHSAGQVYTGRGTSSRGLHARSGPPSQ